jgi:glutamyl-tRNA reductase
MNQTLDGILLRYLKYKVEEYQEWVDKIRQAELEFALKEIRKGADINLVMEAMSTRIMKKLMHHIMIAIKETTKKDQKN